jgi:nucleotide-binding universal stress UspA family protein
MRKPYRVIACCIDRDDMAGAVLDEGARLADGDLTRLRIVHVVAPPRALVSAPFAYITPLWEAADDAQGWLEDVAAAYPGAQAVLLEGPPVRAVSEWVEREGVEMLVAAAARGPMDRALLGGFASHLAYHAPCSVMFVHPERAAADRAGAAAATAGGR